MIQEPPLDRCLRAATGLVVLVGLGSGCGRGEPEVPASKVDLSKVGGNQRLQFKEEYKQMIGKDGKFMMKPGMKTPPKTGR
jgi:hypothetical protein